MFDIDLSLITDANLIFAAFVIFAAGFFAGLSPCTLPTVLFVSAYVTGGRDNSKKRAFAVSLAFILGIALMLTVLGTFAGLAGRMLVDSKILDYTIVAILIIMGLWLLKVFEFKGSGGITDKFKLKKGSGIIGAFLLGIPFGISASPCTMPLTGTVLAYSAARGSEFTGALLMFAFGIGRSIPLLIVGTFSGALKSMEKFTKYQPVIEKIAGVVLIALALYFIWEA
ncbi:cytochrome c biogenesis CcdA family protein [Herbivorax sp. ANBcel31]|uniref:cytochrome c biogenesis CcdA family protein n=1 Tax=Herbivorax sp. ANBcel31 TaxID=3069754 RepID=UPI0027B2A5C8|nr:cytochrome c biogenesis CcdA family protein [Herbivorax sp. ANBcel31]MDQ2087795.1 cytochrome c biogenesis CcdA family protein [Herbivorax sp. ANBcel31]